MAKVLLMPRQGNTVESCLIVKWLKKEGDAVKAADTVCQVETDKAVFEVAAGSDGVLLRIARAEGEDVPVLQPIAVIGAPGEDAGVLLGEAAGAASTPMPGAIGPATPLTPAAGGLASMPTPSAAGAAPAAGEPGVAVTRPGSAKTRRPTGVSPRARMLAKREGLDPSRLTGSGPGGRVIERDVLAALAARIAPKEAALSAAGDTTPSGRVPAERAEIGKFTDTPVRGIRKIIAERMRGSLESTAQLTLSMSAPADRLADLRARFKESPESLGFHGVTIGDLVLFATVKALADYRYMNAHKLDETIRVFDRVHIGLAVDTPRGLMVPVIRGADSLSLRGLSAEARRLGDACRNGRVQPDELSGGTFTVTNLGGLGVESFTPILNAPEVAILGVCGIREEAVRDERLGYRFEKRIGLSLTVNHQAVDGAPAARFLQALRSLIADIDIVLAG